MLATGDADIADSFTDAPSDGDGASVILHDQGNAAIGRIEGIIWQTQALIRVATHLGNLIAAKPLVLHQTAPALARSAESSQFP